MDTSYYESRHGSMRAHMFGKQDHAGRLLTDGQRYAPYPNCAYWESLCDGLCEALQAMLSDEDIARVNELIASQPEGTSWMDLYTQLMAWEQQRLDALRQAA